MNLEERFWAKVKKGAEGECWEWMGGHVRAGYGALLHQGKQRYAHRIAYELMIDLIPSGMQVDHMCHNKGCANPSHMRLATCAENTRNQVRHRDNTSGFKGARYDKRVNRWQGSIIVDRKFIHLGMFATPEEAHVVYCEAAVRYHGAFANFGGE